MSLGRDVNVFGIAQFRTLPEHPSSSRFCVAFMFLNILLSVYYFIFHALSVFFLSFSFSHCFVCPSIFLSSPLISSNMSSQICSSIHFYFDTRYYTNILCDCGQYTRIFSLSTLHSMDVLYFSTPTAEGNITHPCNSRYRGKMFLFIDHSHIEYLLYYILIVK